MPKTYLWYNTKTKKTEETSSWSMPPDQSGNWVRRYAVGFGAVPGAGSSPARQVNQDG